MRRAGIPEIPDEIKNKIMEFWEKVAKKFPESELKNSLPYIKSKIEELGIESFIGLTAFLMDFLLGQSEKNKQPDIKIQIEIMKDYFRLLEFHNTDTQNKHLKELAKKHLEYWEKLFQVEELMSEWKEILISFEESILNGEVSIQASETIKKEISLFDLKNFDPKKRVN